MVGGEVVVVVPGVLVGGGVVVVLPAHTEAEGTALQYAANSLDLIVTDGAVLVFGHVAGFKEHWY